MSKDNMSDTEVERLRQANEALRRLLKEALTLTPDTVYTDDPSWGRAWDELSGEAQDYVKETSARINRELRALES